MTPRIRPHRPRRLGIITSYQVLVSQDGTTFTQVASGNWDQDETLKQVTFPPVQARYVELVGVQGGNDYVSAAEINVIGSPTSLRPPHTNTSQPH